MDDLAWDKIKLLIFDVDGTLYDQSKLRKKMLYTLFLYYVLRPWKYKDIIALYYFRKEREKHAGHTSADLEQEQYTWCNGKTSLNANELKLVVEKWIYDVPNQFLKNYKFEGLDTFFDELKNRNILTAVYSDYPAAKKLKAMGIKVDLIVSSTQAEVNAFKPHPKGLNYILSKFPDVNAEECVFIGDRPELDGACAMQADISFLHISKKEGKFFYPSVLKKLKQ